MMSISSNPPPRPVAGGSGYLDRTALAIEFCEQAAKDHPDRVSFYEECIRCYREKLWHQLTVLVLQFLESTPNQVALYDALILKNHTYQKLDGLMVARMADATARGIHPPDFEAARNILENCMEQFQQTATINNTVDWQALLYLQAKHSVLLLRHNATTTSILELLEEQQQSLLAFSSSSQTNDGSSYSSSCSKIVYAAHYQAAMEYHKRYGPAQSYYQNAMQFLNYDPYCDTLKSKIINLSSEDQQETNIQVATDLILAALTAEHIYDLSAAYQQPIIAHALLHNRNTNTDTTTTDPRTWLVSLLEAVSQGNIQAFENWWNHPKHQQYWIAGTTTTTTPFLANAKHILQEKCTLTALVVWILSKHPHERHISFTEIAQTLHNMEYTAVEWMLMRAHSVGLIRGNMDQTTGMIHITYVRPRQQLNDDQRQDLANKFHIWADRIQSTQSQTAKQLVVTSSSSTPGGGPSSSVHTKPVAT
jgi:26S proteasome regulatory subunit N9